MILILSVDLACSSLAVRFHQFLYLFSFFLFKKLIIKFEVYSTKVMSKLLSFIWHGRCDLISRCLLQVLTYIRFFSTVLSFIIMICCSAAWHLLCASAVSPVRVVRSVRTQRSASPPASFLAVRTRCLSQLVPSGHPSTLLFVLWFSIFFPSPCARSPPSCLNLLRVLSMIAWSCSCSLRSRYLPSCSSPAKAGLGPS